MMIYQTIDPALEAILGHRSAHSLATLSRYALNYFITFNYRLLNST